MGKKKKEEARVDVASLRKTLNKKLGERLVWDLSDEDCPTTVKDWIPTGSFLLDCITRKDGIGGIPIGRLVELAGLEGTGKSYLAACALGNAQKKGYTAVYFDSESSLDEHHLRGLGVDVDQMLYVQAASVEMVFEVINELLGQGSKFFFVWDSYANTPTKSQVESDDFNPNSEVAKAARVNSQAMKKLVIPLANSESTLLVINQLKTNITSDHFEKMFNPYITPGGKALAYAYSMRIWLTKPQNKASFLRDEFGHVYASTVRAEMKKSRFGTEKRKCDFFISWGGESEGILDELSWYKVLNDLGAFRRAGAWTYLTLYDGEEINFYSKDWPEMVKRPEVLEVVQDMIVDTLIKNYSPPSDEDYGLMKEEEVKDETGD